MGKVPHTRKGVKIRSEQRLKDVPMFARDEIARIFTLRYRWTDHKGQVRWGGTLAGSH
jgi:hypothetical protein